MTEAEFNEFNEEEMAEALHLPDEDPNIVDPEGKVQLSLRDTLPPQSIPSTVFFDKQGRVAARVLGAVDEALLNGIIDTLVAEPA